ncbi:MAG: hypothetical protein ACPGUC_00275 [Gammaproteobacteria bacterium]
MTHKRHALITGTSSGLGHALARSDARMPSPLETAENLLSVLEQLRGTPSGGFVDLRALLDPEEYQRVFAGAGGQAR